MSFCAGGAAPGSTGPCTMPPVACTTATLGLPLPTAGLTQPNASAVRGRCKQRVCVWGGGGIERQRASAVARLNTRAPCPCHAHHNVRTLPVAWDAEEEEGGGAEAGCALGSLLHEAGNQPPQALLAAAALAWDSTPAACDRSWVSKGSHGTAARSVVSTTPPPWRGTPSSTHPAPGPHLDGQVLGHAEAGELGVHQLLLVPLLPGPGRALGHEPRQGRRQPPGRLALPGLGALLGQQRAALDQPVQHL